MSPFSRGRGLKYRCLKIKRLGIMSPFSRGRGLKFDGERARVGYYSRPFHEGVD